MLSAFTQFYGSDSEFNAVVLDVIGLATGLGDIRGYAMSSPDLQEGPLLFQTERSVVFS